MKAWSLIALSGVLTALAPAPCFAAEDPHIAVVERDLEPIVQVRDRPVTRDTIAEAMAQHHVPAVSVAVVDHGRIVWAKAWGLADVASKTPATPETIFQAGSISKPVAASAAMQLVQEGKLDLDADANTGLKSWRIPPSAFTAAKPVSLRELLTHTAGMTVHGFDGYGAGAPVPTVVQVLDGKAPANSAPVVVDTIPGTAWRYSGGGITVAQLMMTDVTGQSFPELMQRRVFEPLDMRSSTYEQPLPAARRDAATGYLSSGEPVAGRFHTYPEMAAAGLWTTPTDLAKWIIALQAAYDGRSETLMRRPTAKAMLTPGLGDWGLGLEMKGDGESLRFMHGGDDWGFKAQMVGFLSGGRGVVAMANGDDGMMMVQSLVEAVERAYGWNGVGAKVIDEVPLTEAERARLVGRYGKDPISITSADGKLWAEIPGLGRLELVPTAKDRLVLMKVGAELKVVTDASGGVSGLENNGRTFARAP